MTATNHALTGAVIALAVRQPALVLPLAFLSHYLLDSLPHFGLEPDVPIVERNQSKLFRGVLAVDTILFAIFMMFLMVALNRGIVSWIVPVSSLVAYAPDLGWLYRAWWENKHQSWRKGSVFSQFHTKIQWCERPWGLIVEAMWALASFAVFETFT